MPRGELLLEVRAEEIPARMVVAGARELATRLFEELMARGLSPREMDTGFTLRRLVLVLRGLPPAERDLEEEVLGPPVTAALTADGAPTAALRGFAARCGVEPQDLVRVQTPKGEYVAARRRARGSPTRDVLAELLPRVIAGLSWAKTMVWGQGEGPWVRPVHGVVALFEGEVVPFELFHVVSGDVTRGHPILSPEPFAVTGAADYRRKLTRRGIRVRVEDRVEAIGGSMRQRAARHGGRLVEDAELLARLAAVCEIPGVVEGRIEARFLSLPREVLTTSLRDHQSAFTVEADGDLLPVFLTVMDRPDDPEELVRTGNEWVVAARLADAAFFLEEDSKLPLAERLPLLVGLTFHPKLGSYAEKTERLVELSDWIYRHLGWEGEIEAVREAARLLKADLTTEMVKEFTSLQGKIGGIYARREGYAEAVWQALYDQYLPQAADDPLPRGRTGLSTALADRLDTLAGMFGLGLVPSGSKDPFGLRRAAQGAVRLALEGGLAVDLELAAARAVRLYGDRLRRGAEEVLGDLRPFLHDRIRHLLGVQGFAYDEIEAGLAAGASDLPELRARVAALHEMRADPRFLQVVLAAKRIANILKGSSEQDLREELLVEPAERTLFEAAEALRTEIETAEGERDFSGCLRAIADFADVLDRFFVEVLVMDEDQDLKRNRLALLRSIDRLLSRTATLTEMVVDKSEHRRRQPAAKGEGAPA